MSTFRPKAPQRSATSIRRRRSLRISIAIIVAVFIALSSIAGLYTQVLWFDQLGYLSVFTKQISSQFTTFIVGAVIVGAFIWLNLFLAYRYRPVYVSAGTVFGRGLDEIKQSLERLRKLIFIGVPVLLALIVGGSISGQWTTILAFTNHSYTGVKDPQFHLDVGFYLFDLPFFTMLVGFITAAIVLALLPALIVHVVYGAIKFSGRSATFTKFARYQVSILAALFLLVQAATLWLNQYETLTSPAGLFTGATYSDVNAQIPGLQILASIGVLVAALFLVTAVIGKWRLSILGTALMVVSSIILTGIYPWIVQNFQVVPNERTLESAFIQRNITATRTAYGLDNVQEVAYNATTTASSAALLQDAATTTQIRILDPELVSASFRQLEQYRQYYNFAGSLDVDRYQIGNKTQDTVLAVRELNQSGLGSSQSWYNDTIVYTHGYGVVAAYGNQRTVDGQPVFLQSGIPSKGLLGNYEPRIYFGEHSPSYSIVGAPKGATARELDYPAASASASSDQQTMTSFAGNGGPKLDSFVKRVAYALKFKSEQILLSDAVTDSSQILYDRNPIDRVAAVAPYLTLDSDIYPAVVDGRVKWIVDGYTTSANYPYSRAENLDSVLSDSTGQVDTGGTQINYIRNSVKATVDAYDGSVKLYDWDTKDPILKTYMKIYPGTVSPISEMSGALLSHVRYPADLFRVQRAILGQYHVKDAGAFYSQQDAWMTPNDPVTNAWNPGAYQPPYYLSMKTPADSKSAFSIYSTFIPRSTGSSTRNVLTGYLVANSDAGSTKGRVASSYGRLELLTLPRTAIVPGPGQVQNDFNSDSEVSKLLNILRQGSTKVLDGNLLTLPVGGGLLYVQPVYIQSTGGTSFPLLKKVLVAFGDKIAFEDTLDAALNSLFSGNTNSGGGGTVPGETKAQKLAAALANARQALDDKSAAMAAGDWAAYGKADARLKAAVLAALAASGN